MTRKPCRHSAQVMTATIMDRLRCYLHLEDKASAPLPPDCVKSLHLLPQDCESLVPSFQNRQHPSSQDLRTSSSLRASKATTQKDSFVLTSSIIMSTRSPEDFLRQTSLRRHNRPLTTSMISAPIGDLRHEAHVGCQDDDMFGDLDFLSGRVDLTRTTKTGLMTAAKSTWESDFPPPKPPRLYLLPRNTKNLAKTFPEETKAQPETLGSSQVEEGANTILSANKRTLSNPNLSVSSPTSLRRSSSQLSFNLDLGPSLLDEVFMGFEANAGLQEFSAGCSWLPQATISH
uniref:cdc42 effector protein 2-like n=1 Tax=Myxine glutinosa TaxID=7769 RepID=UPI00358FCA2B